MAEYTPLGGGWRSQNHYYLGASGTSQQKFMLRSKLTNLSFLFILGWGLNP
jgi:hypothetical protein